MLDLGVDSKMGMGQRDSDLFCLLGLFGCDGDLRGDEHQRLLVRLWLQLKTCFVL